MNGSLAHELIEAHFEQIMADFLHTKEYSEEEAEKVAKTEEFQEFALMWISEADIDRM